MKLIFLDIDGVMTSDTGKLNKVTHYPFSISCVSVLNEILKTNDVKIILTSSWRTVFNAETQDLIFKENGVIQTPAGQTKNIGYNHRNLEIKDYLQKRNVESFVILDDMLIEGFDENFVHINPKYGLTETYIEKINQILKTV